ncbi:MAG: alpha/beta fold hydrolase [Deltaproteobacteria bacterium]|nr:alpha/beta fold hydrolase [Deltaproteobacteria bacterium]
MIVQHEAGTDRTSTIHPNEALDEALGNGDAPRVSTDSRAALCLHGFLRTGLSMVPMARALVRGGWAEAKTPTFAYQHRALEDVAREVRELAKSLADKHGSSIDLVTHSFGGVVARAALPDLPARRIVMLSPPNQGAELAELVRNALPLHRLGWDPLAPMLPGAPAEHPSGPAEIGILTGGRGDDRGFNPLLDGDNDGKVRIVEAMLEGAKDFRVLQVRHPFIMMSPKVHSLVLRFLEAGTFGD